MKTNTLSNFTRRVLQNAPLVGKAFPTRKSYVSTVFWMKIEITPLVRDEEVGGSNPLEPTITFRCLLINLSNLNWLRVRLNLNNQDLSLISSRIDVVCQGYFIENGYVPIITMQLISNDG